MTEVAIRCKEKIKILFRTFKFHKNILISYKSCQLTLENSLKNPKQKLLKVSMLKQLLVSEWVN